MRRYRRLTHTVTAREVSIMIRLVASLAPSTITGRDADEGRAVVHHCKSIMEVGQPDDLVRIVP